MDERRRWEVKRNASVPQVIDRRINSRYEDGGMR